MIRIALVGCGGISKAHFQRFHELKSRLQVVATVDTEIERAQAAAEQLPGARAVADFRAVFDDVDAMLLVLPHHLHHEVGMECLAAGKHILIEKPLANTERECLDLIEAAESRNLILMTAYCMRYHPLSISLHDALKSGKYGDTFHMSIWTEQLTEVAPDHWMARAATVGGGQLFSHGCHYVDLLLWYLGEPVEGTHIGTNFGTPWMEREGTSDMFMKFANGAVAYHSGTWGARGSRLFTTFHAHTPEGLLEADFVTGRLMLHRWQKPVEMLAQSHGSSKYMECEMEHFLDCVETGARPDTDGRRSLQSLRVIWRLYEAEQQHIVADLRGLGLDGV